MLIVGGGVIGCEYASMFAAMRVEVSLVEGRPRLVSFLDTEIAERLRGAMQSLGVTFHLGTSVTKLDSDGSSITRIITSDGQIHADAVVLAAGAASPLLTRTMGHRIPVYPAKGYTLTATIKDPDRAPRIGGIDERTLVAWSRFGGELRMSATAEFVGYDRSSTLRTTRTSSTRATSCSPAPSTGTPRGTARAFAR